MTTVAKHILPIEIEPLEEGGYVARNSALLRFLVQADTIEKVISLSPGVAHIFITRLTLLNLRGVVLAGGISREINEIKVLG
jgi:hypothetical protein